jgi:hypothetical protein
MGTIPADFELIQDMHEQAAAIKIRCGFKCFKIHGTLILLLSVAAVPSDGKSISPDFAHPLLGPENCRPAQRGSLKSYVYPGSSGEPFPFYPLHKSA